jgi:hypothetical protein
MRTFRFVCEKSNIQISVKKSENKVTAIRVFLRVFPKIKPFSITEINKKGQPN